MATDSPVISDSTVIIPPAQSVTDTPSVADTTTVSPSQTTTETPSFSDGTVVTVNAGTVTPTFTFPSGVSGSITTTPATVSNPTSNGNTIIFLGTVQDLTLSSGSCATGCTISFTFTDADLAAAGISIADVVIFQDSEEDGTFVPLTTTITDGAPSPFTVSATTFTTSLFGAGKSSPTTGGGGGGGDTTDPSVLVGFTDNEFPLEVSGVRYKTYELGSVHTTTVNAGDRFSTILRVFENGGPQNIQHAEIYVNHHGNRILNDLTETAVIYDRQSGIRILDPNGLIASANVVVSESGNKAEFNFEIVFAKEIPQSDILFRLWDTARNDMELYLPNSLIVLPGQNTGIIQEKPSSSLAEPLPVPKDQPQEAPTPEEILPKEETVEEEIERPTKFTSEQLAILKRWGGFDVQSADDSEVLTTFGIKGTKIPSWFKNTAKWYIDGEVTKDEFVTALMYFKKEGLLDDASSPIKTMKEVNTSSNLTKLQSNGKITIEQKAENSLYAKADIRQIEDKVAIIRAIANNPQIQEIIINSNNEFDKNSQAEQLIEERDLDWKRNWKTITPFMKELMNNKGALIANAVIENEQKELLPIKSILITNSYGVNVIITNLIPDYKQSDEKWWKVAKMEGIYITSGTSSDEYSGVLTGEIILPITDSDGKFIGVIKAAVNLEKTLTRN
ncbi:MAG: hypothetical protein AB1608_02675 [Thermoproteota archaeon]